MFLYIYMNCVIELGKELDMALFNVAHNLRSKMNASEYKNYLLDLIFYKYLSDKLLSKVVELSYEDESVYTTKGKQTELYMPIISDDDVSEDLNATLIDTLDYVIEPEHLYFRREYFYNVDFRRLD